MRSFLLSVVLVFSISGLKAQEVVTVPKDSIAKDAVVVKTTDTVKKRPAYVNPGKIAGRRAAFRSMILPGMGQLGNGVTVYRLAKVAAIYTGATLLTLSYIDNNKNYNLVLDELKYRAQYGKPSPGPLGSRQDDGLIQAKDTFERNKEVIIFSYVGIYLLNIIEAYIDARLKYFNVDDIAGIKVTPGLVRTDMMYGYNQPVPGIKLTLKF